MYKFKLIDWTIIRSPAFTETLLNFLSQFTLGESEYESKISLQFAVTRYEIHIEFSKELIWARNYMQ